MARNDCFGKCGDAVTHFAVLKLVPSTKKGESEYEKQALLVNDGETEASLDRFTIDLLSPEWIVKHWGDGTYQIQWWVEKENKWTANGYGREGVVLQMTKRRGRPPKQLPMMDPPAKVTVPAAAPIAAAMAPSSSSVLPSSFQEMQAFMGIISEREAATTDRLAALITAVMGGQPKPPSTEDIARGIKAAVDAATAPLVAELAKMKAELAEWEEDDDDDDDEEEVELPRNVKHGVQIAAKQALKEVPTVSQVADLAKEGLSVARDAVNKWSGGAVVGGKEASATD